MNAVEHRLDLHPRVELKWLGEGACEVTDHRTGFRLALEEIGNGAELELLFAELGLLGSEAAPEQVRVLQHRFRQSQAWEERLERFRRTLEFARAQVPFYRSNARAYDPDSIRQAGDLRQIPRLARRDVHAHFLDLCAEGVDLAAGMASGRWELVRTSGTTSERMQAFSDAELVRIPGNYAELWGIAPSERIPRTAVLTSATCIAEQCTLGGADFQARIQHEHTLFLPAPRDLFSMTRAEAQAIAEDLRRFEPELLLVNPVYAHWYARKAVEFGIELWRPRALISSYQYLSLAQRRALTRHFAAPIFNQYTATELGGCQVGLECRFGRLHAREDHCLVEFLGRDGRARSDGLGAVVVTTLEGSLMPLVRYAIGDLGEPSAEPCACALEDWPSFTLHGREREALVLGDRWLTTRQLDELVASEQGVDFHCCRQRGDSVVLDIVPALDAEPDVAGLQARLQAALECSSVRVQIVRRLEPAPSLKYPQTQRSERAVDWFLPC